MALAHSIERVLENTHNLQTKAVGRLALSTDAMERAAFPSRLWRKLSRIEGNNRELFRTLTRMPVLMDRISYEEETDDAQERELDKDIKDVLGANPETYYALVLMDGDRMGAWLSGTEAELLPGYSDVLHTKAVDGLKDEFASDNRMAEYLGSKRPITPARHQAISRALNNFSLHLAREVVEEKFTGKLLYAGGDDLLAMVSVADLPGLMLALRCLYSGIMLDNDEAWQSLTYRNEKLSLHLRNGYAQKDKRLFAMMGPRATASIGAVIAHHKAPLGRVLRSLRAAERAAKNLGERDAFCITLEKRSGGTTALVGKWEIDGQRELEQTTIGALLKLRDTLAREGVSRRAAYVVHDVLRDIPSEVEPLTKVITHRLKRQGAEGVDELVGTLVELALNGKLKIYEPHEGRGAIPPANRWLQEVFVIAEFLARRERSFEGGDNE